MKDILIMEKNVWVYLCCLTETNMQESFFNDNIEGYGIFTWQDGRQYEGKWKDNKMHGKGLLHGQTERCIMESLLKTFNKEMEK